LNSSGVVQWQNCLGGSNIDIAHAVQQTLDGGYIIAGQTLSNDGDITNLHGNSSDYWIVKLSSSGSLEWQKTYGGSMTDQAYSIQQTLDSGYIVAGRAYSIDGDVNGLHGTIDCWIVKLNSTGSILWNKCLGGASAEEAYSIKQSSDGGYIIAGKTRSTDGDVTGNHGGLSDFWIIKLSNYNNVYRINSTITNFQINPNPINNSSIISFSLKRQNKVIINIYDFVGNNIIYKKEFFFESGFHSIYWLDLLNSQNNLNNGFYLFSVEIDDIAFCKKIEILNRK
jgi:hypothetical protein